MKILFYFKSECRTCVTIFQENDFQENVKSTFTAYLLKGFEKSKFFMVVKRINRVSNMYLFPTTSYNPNVRKQKNVGLSETYTSFTDFIWKRSQKICHFYHKNLSYRCRDGLSANLSQIITNK